MSTTAEFFDGLAQRGHEPLLERATGTVRFDLVENGRDERWLVAVDKGDIAVSHRNVTADCTLRANRSLFDGVASGQVNAMAAVIRGAIQIEGDWSLLVLFQRVFPTSANARSAV
jgi:putative sterol carrier protein